MDSRNHLNTLYQYARDRRFAEFEKLFSRLEPVLPPGGFGEAWLMRAQVKLCATDGSAIQDLMRAEEGRGEPRFPCLATQWKADAPNRLCVFPKEPGLVAQFLHMLPQAGARLAAWYGEQGHALARQLQMEIVYFTGDFPAALALAEEQPYEALEDHTGSLLVLAMKYRCHLALGNAARAEECMLDMIRLSKAYPECVAPYQAFRGWAVITTSWSGDTPRFYADETGARLPVLEDRLESIQSGMPLTTPLELPFLEYARQAYPSAYKMRQLYMDVFNAVYWHSVGDHKQARALFLKLYGVIEASGMTTPLVECGEQALPLLRYALDNIAECPKGWTERTIQLARRYEAGVNAYQAMQNE